jgi:hypothetical protein
LKATGEPFALLREPLDFASFIVAQDVAGLIKLRAKLIPQQCSGVIALPLAFGFAALS